MIDMLKNLGQTITGKADDSDLTPEEIAANEKAARIDFHRTSVRNGPVSFKTITAGQERRARQRTLAKVQRKNFRAEVRAHFKNLRLASIIRPHLQGVGLIAYVDGHEPDLHTQIVSTAWLNQRFGRETIIEGRPTGHVSFAQADVRDALKAAAAFYEKATGHIVRVPANFELAIYADES